MDGSSSQKPQLQIPMAASLEITIKINHFLFRERPQNRCSATTLESVYNQKVVKLFLGGQKMATKMKKEWNLRIGGMAG